MEAIKMRECVELDLESMRAIMRKKYVGLTGGLLEAED